VWRGCEDNTGVAPWMGFEYDWQNDEGRQHQDIGPGNAEKR
jgi:hypothetical protein